MLVRLSPGSLEIHQTNPNRYFGKASFLLDPLDLGSQHLAGVQQAGKNDVVLLGDISELLFVCREDEDRIAHCCRICCSREGGRAGRRL